MKNIKTIFITILIYVLCCSYGYTAESWMCGKDLDNDGAMTTQGEVAPCLTVGSNHICPLDAEYCKYPTTYTPDACPAGTSLNTISDKCDASPTNFCTGSYILIENPSPGGCIASVICPTGSSLNVQTDFCEQPPGIGCNPPFIFNSVTNQCESPPVCLPGAAYNSATDRCETLPTVDCAAGLYNQQLDMCIGPPDCPGGTYNQVLDRCETELVAQVNGATCSTDGSYYATMTDCNYTCPFIYGPALACTLQWYGEYGWYECPYGPYPCSYDEWTGSTTCSGPAGGTCSDYITMVCPSGYTQAGSICVNTNRTCPSNAAFNTVERRCESPVSHYSCTEPYELDFTARTCHSAPSCAASMFNGTADVCYRPANSFCQAGFFYEPGSAVCQMSPAGLCAADAPYSPVLDACRALPQKTCPSATVYSASTDRCEADPTCNGHPGTQYYPAQDACVNKTETTSCPLPGGLPCVQNPSGDYQCSSSCHDIDAEGGTTITGGDSGMLTDDGPRDANGNCIGEIYIFSGKQMECNESGHKSGYKNCCLSGEPTLADDVGSGVNIYNLIKGIKTVYELGEVAAWSYGMAAEPVAEAGTPMAAAVDTITAGGSLMEGFGSYFAAMFNPTTIIIAAVILIVQYFILDGSCTQDDMEAAMMKDSGRCHEVGDYCSQTWSGMGCVQKTKVMCCFNSKLARIIHEQGRPQLKSFNPVWGSIIDDEPNLNCRGFSPAEFQMLDFSKIDLTEYFNDIKTRVSSELQQDVQDSVNKFYQQQQLQP